MAGMIKVSYSGRIATITIDNDKKLNALDMDGYYAISQALREIALRDDVYITILTGKGRYFSAYVSFIFLLVPSSYLSSL
jgi:peroxisomal 3,2-trans-enoyl-CoA isomerase